MKRFFRFLSDRRLLKRCHEDDPDAQRLFDNLSYSNEVARAVQETFASCEFSDDLSETDAVIDLCISQVYENWGILPQLGVALRKRIRKYSVAFAKEYVRNS